MRKRFLGIVALAGVGLVAGSVAAQAGIRPVVGIPDPNLLAPTYEVSGVVTDPLGTPIAGATVTDAPGGDVQPGYQSTVTDASGAYQLSGVTTLSHEEDVTARNIATLTAFKTGYDAASADLTVMALPDGTNFVLPFHIDATVSPEAFNNPTGGTNVAITATTSAPATACVKWSNGTDTVTLAHTTGSTWTGAYHVAGDAPEGSTDWTVGATDTCAGDSISGTAEGTYVVDKVAPVLSAVGPAATNSSTPVITGTIVDKASNTTTVQNDVDNAGISVLVDGSPVAATFLPVTNGNSKFTAQTPSLSVGTHTVAVSVTDRAGNHSAAGDFSGTFIVDLSAPTIDTITVDGQAVPTTTTSNTPTILFHVADVGAGLVLPDVANGIVTSVSDGVLTGKVNPADISFNSLTNMVSITIPAAGGPLPGQHAMAPGAYSVHIELKDKAGNVAVADFGFTVA